MFVLRVISRGCPRAQHIGECNRNRSCPIDTTVSRPTTRDQPELLAWSSGAINGAMMVIVVVLGLILFELSMTTASAPATMDQRSDAPRPAGWRDSRCSHSPRASLAAELLDHQRGRT